MHGCTIMSRRYRAFLDSLAVSNFAGRLFLESYSSAEPNERTISVLHVVVFACIDGRLNEVILPGKSRVKM